MSEIIVRQTQPENSETNSHVVFFYDGYCNLCSNFVQFIKARNHFGLVDYAPLQSSEVKQFLSNHNFDAHRLDTIVCAQDGNIYTKSTAVIKILQNLSEPWPIVRRLLVIPVVIRDWVYDLVASNRYKLFGQRDACYIPDSDVAASLELLQKNRL